MHRFFSESVFEGCAVICGEDHRHLSKVLRLTVGDLITVCDGKGTDHTCRIDEIDGDMCSASVISSEPSPAEPQHRVTLFQGLPKSGKMETIVQKSVELGVHSIVPVLTERCVALPGKDFEHKRVRLQRVAMEAAKQSMRGIIPEVRGWVRLEDADLSSYDTVLVAYEDERELTLKQAIRENCGRSVAVIIGPEGGFEEGEIRRIMERVPAKAVSLGRRILRTETAGPAMIAQLLYELE